MGITMGNHYSQVMRARAVGAVDEGPRAFAPTPLFQAGISYIYRALGHRKATVETNSNISVLFSDLDQNAVEDLEREPFPFIFSVVSWEVRCHGLVGKGFKFALRDPLFSPRGLIVGKARAASAPRYIAIFEGHWSHCSGVQRLWRCPRDPNRSRFTICVPGSGINSTALFSYANRWPACVARWRLKAI
jgi:hypothetical protein